MVYRNLIGGSRYPFVVLNLEIPPLDVDVNVHPTKKEVRYKNPNQIFNFIYSALDTALKNTTTTLMPEKVIEKTLEEKQLNIVKQEPLASNNFGMPDNTSNLLPFIKEEKENNDEILVQDNESISDIFQYPKEQKPKNENKANFHVVGNDEKNYLQSKFISTPEYKQEDNIIGQYKKTYILIEKDEGLEIVDQHIADERYIYETLKKTKNIDCQLLFISDVIEISSSDKELLEINKSKLEKFGFEIDFLSDTEVIFRKVPQLLSKVSPKDILADLLENMSGDLDNIEEEILITTSCKAAVKANTYLNQYQMEEIIRNWRKCENPETCPHGRPISKLIEHKTLAKFFQRNL
jgi:DNA mismatch repair protein MutL